MQLTIAIIKATCYYNHAIKESEDTNMDKQYRLVTESGKILLGGETYSRRGAESQREELYNQPKLKGLNGPMWNGWGTLKSTGETVAIIRYEKPCRF